VRTSRRSRDARAVTRRSHGPLASSRFNAVSGHGGSSCCAGRLRGSLHRTGGSTSRDHAASQMKSGFDFRPKAPPNNVTLITLPRRSRYLRRVQASCGDGGASFRSVCEAGPRRRAHLGVDRWGVVLPSVAWTRQPTSSAFRVRPVFPALAPTPRRRLVRLES
jgi:hypothetical protein